MMVREKMFYVFNGSYSSNQSELDWYEKAQDVLINHGYWNDELEPLWYATLNMIFLEFCEIACDEAFDIDLMTAFLMTNGLKENIGYN